MSASRDLRGIVAGAGRRARVRRIAGLALVIAAALPAVAIAAEGKPASKTTAPSAPTVRATPAPAAKAAPAPARKSDGNVTMPAGKMAKGTKPGSKTAFASANGTGAPVVVPATPSPSQAPGSTLAHLDDHLTYQYNTLGRRDPFQSLVDGAFVAADQGGNMPPDIGGVKVVGIVWGAADQFALVEDARGNSFVLRKGDKIQNGYVEGLKRDGVIVNLTADGQSQTVIIPLTKKGEQK